ncbi:MAG: hypothetical protein M3M95_03125 [Pseudomonadota bacterium]|nr:hypothetical protein [Pseudomonadota bacterium]
MTPEHSDSRLDSEAIEAELERVRRELQEQLIHARAMLDQSRRFFNAAASEPRSFRRDRD